MSSHAVAQPWQDDLQNTLRRLAAVAWGGAIAGLVFGGIGGRLAMFLLRVTSDPELRGRETDDGFIIGAFTSDTVFLVLVATAIGMIAGIAYWFLRAFLPERHRTVLAGLIGAIFGGAVIIRPGGIDFTSLDPLALAVAMFIVLPGLQGAATAVLIERFLARADRSANRSWIVAIVALLPLALAGPVGGLILVATLVLWAVTRRMEGTGFPNSDRIQRAAHVLLVGVGAWFGYTLVKDVVEIL